MTSGILVFGASQRTGLEVARILTGRGERVTAFVRPTSDRENLEKLGVDFAVGDVIKYTQDDDAVPESKKIGSGKGEAGAVVAHIIGNGDAR